MFRLRTTVLTHAWERLQILAANITKMTFRKYQRTLGVRIPAAGEHGRGGDPEC
jgi:hypothetical protein